MGLGVVQSRLPKEGCFLLLDTSGNGTVQALSLLVPVNRIAVLSLAWLGEVHLHQTIDQPCSDWMPTIFQRRTTAVSHI